jgi:UrcA family protein
MAGVRHIGRMTVNKLFVATAALATALVNIAAAVPASAGTVPTRTVGYADLSLTSASGQAALKTRVRHAAQAVCAIDGDKSLEAAMQENRCERVAVAKAMPQVELALANAGTQVADNGRVSVAAH